MATVPSYATDYMKRIAFLDGQVLHDFHLNMMQKNIAEAIKLKTTRERYDMYLLVSPYDMYFCEPFINNTDRDGNSTAALNTLSFSINSGAWESSLLELPLPTEEINLVSNFEDYPSKGAYVKFYFRSSKTADWQEIRVDQPILLETPRKYIQIKVECTYTGTVRPSVYDFALMWR
ncbi:hypothetical protein [Bacillus cereus]|uniref:hypothetical protein n=1 Tax=Bacillus cereus TaxID=1396 RepID=UPI000BFD1B8E|nr:hypothetical protein [Bacillus cereus]PGV22881.1 hypothetical protein COD93_28870 [Bacillus cereus]HDX9674213.1 hypothetical protein [Bacillus cereus]